MDLTFLIKKSLLLFLIILFFGNAYSIEIVCDFEEVYKNGEIQQGKLLVKDSLLRYQYEKTNLYTLVYNQSGLYLKDNFGERQSQRINGNDVLIKKILEILKNYPEIKNQYKEKDLHLIIEDGIQNNFVKRIAVNSNNLSLSIYFNNCKNIKINSLYFDHKEFIKFND